MPNAIPGNSDLAAMHAAAGAQAAAPASAPTHQPNTMIPGLQSPVTVNVPQGQPQQAARPASNGFEDGAPARGNQQDWFSGEGLDEPQAPQAPSAPQAPTVPQAPMPEDFSGIDDLLRDLPSQGVQEPQQQQVPQLSQQPSVPVPAAPPALSAEEVHTRAMNELMGREYQIPEADARRLISEPETVLPRLAAQVHLNAVRDIGQYLPQLVSQMVAQGVEQRLGAMRAEMEFFGRYPALNRPEFKPTVAKALTLTRQSNPQMDRESLMREGAVLAAHLIKSTHRRQGPQAPQPRAVVAPYTPAASFGGAPVPQNPNGQTDNIFSQLGSDPSLFDF